MCHMGEIQNEHIMLICNLNFKLWYLMWFSTCNKLHKNLKSQGVDYDSTNHT